MLDLPSGLAIGAAGELYVSDTGHFRVRVVRDGNIFNFAGIGISGYAGDGADAIVARLASPHGLAFAPDGALYIADVGNARVRKVAPGGVMTTLAGNGNADGPADRGDGGTALAANVKAHGVAVGADGRVYMAEYDYNRIRVVGTDGIIQTFAGTGSDSGALNFGDGGPATQANLSGPDCLAMDVDGSLLIADKLHSAIRRVTAQGVIQTVAGAINLQGYDAASEGTPASLTTLNEPRGIGVGPDGTYYIADTLVNRIRKVAIPETKVIAGKLVFPSPDGSQLYHFAVDGRHEKTTDALTGATLLQFGYDGAGRIASIADAFGRQTQINYGSPVTVTGPDGQTTQLQLNSEGRLAEFINPAGERHSFTYHDGGLLATMKDPKANAEGGNPHVFTFTDGRLTSDEDPLGHTKTTSSLALPGGRTVSFSTPMGRATSYHSTASGLVQSGKEVKDPAGLVTKTQRRSDLEPMFASPDAPDVVRYTSVTQLPDGSSVYERMSADPRFGPQVPFVSERKVLSRSDGTGPTQLQTTARSYTLASDGFTVSSMTETVSTNNRDQITLFDRNGIAPGVNRRIVTSPGHRTVTTYLDDVGLPRQIVADGIAPSFFAYDASGRLTHLAQGTDPDCADPSISASTLGCRRSRRTYFSSGTQAGYLSTIVDASGVETSYQHDPVGRVLSETRSLATTGLAWDANGNATSVQPPGRTAHTMTYSPVDLLGTYQPPPAGLSTSATTYSYDEDRMLRDETRPDGLHLVSTPDAAGRIDTIGIAGGLVDYDYYPSNASVGAGRASDIRGPYGVDLHFTYDGMLLKQTSWAGGVSGTVAFEYNDDFDRTRQTVAGSSGSSSTVFGYDLDRLLTCASPTSCTPAAADSLQLVRQSQNGLIDTIILGNTTETLHYNAFGELAAQTAAYSTTPLLSITYDAEGAERDVLGRIVAKEEVQGGVETDYRYSYDNLRRLTDVTVNGTLREHFEYDTNGNRTLGFDATAGITSIGVYDAQDRLLSYGPFDFTYTANGELETKTNRDTGEAWAYQYDALGNLLTVGLPNGDLVEYLVDGMGRRVGKKKNGVLLKQWIYRDALKPVAELDGTGVLVAEFVYGSKSNVPDYVRRGGNTYRVISDQLGSPRYVVNVANASDVPFTATYTSFGVVTGTGLDWMPFGFAGGIYDGDSGVIRYGRRDYDPGLGRWISKEPLRFRAGKNFYVYAFNDPVNLFDPTGRQPTGAGGASGQGEGGGEGTGPGGGYSPAPSGSGYTDYNVTASFGPVPFGVTGGLFVDEYGEVHPYFGGGPMTPTLCGSVNESIVGSVSPDEWSGQLSGSFLNSDAAIGYGGGSVFVESGQTYPPLPGVSATVYYTW